MQPSYNLVTAPWIPVQLQDGTRSTLSLHDTLIRAKDIAGIEDPSPLVTMAIYRFLLAVLYRALAGPTTLEEAQTLLAQGLPTRSISTYLTRCTNRFDLFDPNYPFAQHSAFIPKHPRPWTALGAEYNADSAKVLFDHSDVRHPGTIPPARAVRLLLATQTFAISAGKSELAHTSTAPSATAAMILPIGRTLEDTLIFGLVPQPLNTPQRDTPFWERDADDLDSLAQGVTKPVHGYASLYAWPSRTIKLMDTPDGMIESIGFASGIRADLRDLRDPMLAYRHHDVHGMLPLQLRERGLWRDFDSLLPDQSPLGPAIVRHAIALSRTAPTRCPSTLLIAGQLPLAGKAKIERWQMEHYTLPTAILDSPDLRAHLHTLLQQAETTAQVLYKASRTYARLLLSRGDREPAPEDLKRLLTQFPIQRAYWSTLETHFHTILHTYQSHRQQTAIEHQWAQAIRHTLTDTWATHARSVRTNDAWGLRALTTATGLIDRHHHQLREWMHTLTHKETAA